MMETITTTFPGVLIYIETPKTKTITITYQSVPFTEWIRKNMCCLTDKLAHEIDIFEHVGMDLLFGENDTAHKRILSIINQAVNEFSTK